MPLFVLVCHIVVSETRTQAETASKIPLCLAVAAGCRLHRIGSFKGAAAVLSNIGHSRSIAQPPSEPGAAYLGETGEKHGVIGRFPCFCLCLGFICLRKASMVHGAVPWEQWEPRNFTKIIMRGSGSVWMGTASFAS